MQSIRCNTWLINSGSGRLSRAIRPNGQLAGMQQEELQAGEHEPEWKEAEHGAQLPWRQLTYLLTIFNVCVCVAELTRNRYMPVCFCTIGIASS